MTWHYEVLTRWGWTSHDLTADVPMLAGNQDASRLFGQALWQLAIAPAISGTAELRIMWTATWRQISVPVPVPVSGARGLQLGSGTSREESAQLVLLTGHNDDMGRRRIFLPAVPQNWVRNELLQPLGMEALTTLVRGWYMGLRPIAPDIRLRWLIAYLDVIDGEVGNPYGVGFREVNYVRVCQHTDRAPELPSGLWP